MIYYLTYAAASLTGVYLLWIFYLAVMSLKRAYDDKTISKQALFFGKPLLVAGLLIDLLVNVFVASIVLLEPPREFTVSDRLSRLIRRNPNGWRGKSACWFCNKFLDVFDPSGRHCK